MKRTDKVFFIVVILLTNLFFSLSPSAIYERFVDGLLLVIVVALFVAF